MNAKQSNGTWLAGAIVSAALSMAIAGPANGQTGEDPNKRMGSRVVRDIAITAGVKTAGEWLGKVIAGLLEPDTQGATTFFNIPEEEYERWPEGRRQVVQGFFAYKEDFHKRTIALLKTLDTADWELLERAAGYVIIPAALLPTHGLGKGTLSFNEFDVNDEVELETMGIIGSPGVLGALRSFGPHSKERLHKAIPFGDHALVMRFNHAEQVVDWPVTPITKVGQEIFTLMQKVPNLVTPEWNYIRALGEGLAKSGITVELWEASQVPNTNVLKREKTIWKIEATS